MTGGSGFIGGRLLEALRGIPDCALVALVRDPAAISRFEDRVEVVPGSLEDPAALRRAAADADLVFHLAGSTRSWTEAGFRAANADGTRRLLEACREVAPRMSRFVLASSQAAAGPSRDGRPLIEDAPPAPVSRYGASKLQAERLLAEDFGDLPATVLRPPAVYGPGERDILALFRMARRGLVPVLGIRERRYSFVYVDDLVAALIGVAVHPKSVGRTYYAAHPEVVSDARLVAAVGAAVGRRPGMLRLPGLLGPVLGGLAALARPLLRRPPLINPDRAREMAPRAWICDPARLRDELGIRCSTGIEEGARRAADWYRAQGWLPARIPSGGAS